MTEDVIRQLWELHPKPPPDAKTPPETTALLDIDTDTLAKIVNTKLKNGSAPGPSGWTGELVAVSDFTRSAD